MDDEFLKQRARLIRELADKADLSEADNSALNATPSGLLSSNHFSGGVYIHKHLKMVNTADLFA
jgi:hypothetical protein